MNPSVDCHLALQEYSNAGGGEAVRDRTIDGSKTVALRQFQRSVAEVVRDSGFADVGMLLSAMLAGLFDGVSQADIPQEVENLLQQVKNGGDGLTALDTREAPGTLFLDFVCHACSYQVGQKPQRVTKLHCPKQQVMNLQDALFEL